MTEYDIYLVNPTGFVDTLGMIGTVEASNPEEAKKKASRKVKKSGDNLLTAAGYNVHENRDEIKDMIRIYPKNYRSGI